MARRRLSGRTVLVTGAGGGLGRAIALRFAAGVDVMVVCPSFVATRIDRNALGGDGLPARHAQVTVGRPLAPAVVADRICAGALRGRRLPLIGRTARAAWWLSRLAPGLYEMLMARRLGGKLESDAITARRDHDRKPSP